MRALLSPPIIGPRRLSARPAGSARATPASRPVPTPGSGRCACGGACPACTGKSGAFLPSPAAAGSGQALPAATRQSFERALGTDLSRVRLHTGPAADAATGERGARAFARGHDIFFRSEAFAPDTMEGRRLLAHELTHVAQQTGESLPGDSVDAATAEIEADRTAETVVQGGRIGRGSLHRTDRRVAAKAVEVCDPTNHEGKPLIWFDRNAPARSHRPATGYAQERLNEQLSIVFDCLLDPACRAGLPPENVAFMESLIPDLDVPLVPDCQFGGQTERATKIVQAFYFKDPAEWDGMIGEKTWRVIDQAPAPPPGPTIFLPNAPVPIPPGPIFI